ERLAHGGLFKEAAAMTPSVTRQSQNGHSLDKAGRKATKGELKLSRLHKPAGMSLEEWQRELRKQFGRKQPFSLRNIGGQPIFSEFEVTNSESGNCYRVAIRGAQPGDNYCSCPDFATNDLGTCKHVEFTLAQLEKRRG